MADYRLLYTDLKTGIIKGELPVISFGWSDGINASGSLSATLPLDDSSTIEAPDGAGGSEEVDIPQTITIDTLAPGRTGIYVERDGVLLWGGVIWTAELNVASSTINIGAGGFMTYLDRLHLVQDYNPSGIDQGAIAKSLVDTAMALPGADIGITMATPTVSTSRTRNYWSTERPVVGELFRQLADVKNGFTWGFTYTYDNTTDPDNPTVLAAIVLDVEPLGRSTNIVFELGVNVGLLSLSLDGSSMANAVTYTTTVDTTNATLYVTESDAASQVSYPRLETVVQATDVRDVDTLTAKAQHHLQRTKTAVERLSLSAYTDAEPNLGSYTPGDQATVRGSHGALQVSGTYRLVDLNVSVDTSGLEVTNINLVPLEVFS